MQPKSRKAYIGGEGRKDMISNEQKQKVGPGQYDSPSKLGGPKYTIGKKRKLKVSNDVPGSGAYNANDKLTKPKTKEAYIA